MKAAKKTTNTKKAFPWVNRKLLHSATAATYAVLIASWLLPDRLPLTFILILVSLLMPLTMFSIVFAMYSWWERDATNDTMTNSPAAKVVSILLVCCLAVSVWASSQALNTPLYDSETNRFVYENLATATLIGALVTAFILSAIQRDIYLVKPKSGLKLDERQTEHRKQVFEYSYRLGLLLVVLTVLFIYDRNADAARMLDLDGFVPGASGLRFAGGSLPIDFYKPLYAMIVALFSLPLLVATWKQRWPK